MNFLSLLVATFFILKSMFVVFLRQSTALDHDYSLFIGYQIPGKKIKIETLACACCAKN